MSTPPSTVSEDEEPPITRDDAWAALMLLVAALVAGIVAAVIWRLVVRLPSYTVQADGSASVTERALTEVFAGDSWYVVLGVVFGAALGIAAWLRFRSLGWLAAFLALALGLAAGIVCWQFGQLLGGTPFDERLAAAKPGDSVPISLALRSPSALAVWAFAAVTPVLLGSALGPDEDASPRERRSLRNRRAVQPASTPTEVVDELGVVRSDEVAGSPRE